MVARWLRTHRSASTPKANQRSLQPTMAKLDPSYAIPTWEIMPGIFSALGNDGDRPQGLLALRRHKDQVGSTALRADGRFHSIDPCSPVTSAQVSRYCQMSGRTETGPMQNEGFW